MPVVERREVVVDELGRRRARREQAALQPVAGLETLRETAHDRRAPGGDPDVGEAEPVGGVPRTSSRSGPVGSARESLAHVLEASCFECAGELDLHAMAQVADRAGRSVVEVVGRVRRIEPGRERDDAHVEPARGGEIHPAQRGGLAGGVGVEAEEEPASSRRPSSFSCASVSAVPIEATTVLRDRAGGARARRCSPRRRPPRPAWRSRRGARSRP